jgi:hypothetical protein
MLQHVEIGIELIDERNRSRNIQLCDVCINSNIPASETLLKTLTIALKLLPWATTKTRFPDLIVGTIVSFQYGSTRSIVIFKL